MTFVVMDWFALRLDPQRDVFAAFEPRDIQRFDPWVYRLVALARLDQRYPLAGAPFVTLRGCSMMPGAMPVRGYM